MTSDERARIIARYSTSLHEPLLRVDEVVQIHQDMVELVAAHPHLVMTWFGRVTHVGMRALSPNDPMAQMSAHYFGFHWIAPNSPATDRGAMRSDGLVFGTWSDASDLSTPMQIDDLGCDLEFAAVADTMIPEDAALLAMAGHSVEQVHLCLRTAWKITASSKHRPCTLWDHMDAVMRRLVHRLRQYTGGVPPQWLEPLFTMAWTLVEDPDADVPSTDDWVAHVAFAEDAYDSLVEDEMSR